MKNSISHIISFISMILITFYALFIIVEIGIRRSVLIDKLDETDYYESAYENIILNLDKSITNEDIRNEYKKYITIDMIKRDIIGIIIERNISHYDNFYKLVSKYSADKEVCSKNASIINNIYLNNIFPTKEYKLINKIYIKTKCLILYIGVLTSTVLILQLGLYIINKNFKYNKISLLSSAILNIFPFIFVNITGILNNVVYVNSYYTKFLFSIFDSTIRYLFVIGFIIILMYLVSSVIKKESKK